MSDEGTDDMLSTGSQRERGGGTAATDAAASSHRLEFSIGDNVLPYDMTVYQAVQQFGAAPMFEVSDSDSDNRSAVSAALYGSPG